MEFPGLVVKLELQLQVTATAAASWDLSHIYDLCHSLQQCWILNAVSEARDRTYILTDTMLGSFFFRATLAAYGGYQARGQIGASCTYQFTPQPQQHQIQATSATYTTTHSNAGSSTH